MNVKLILAGVALFVLRWVTTARVSAQVGGTQVSLPVLAVVAVIAVAAAVATIAGLLLAARSVVSPA